jgi:hypothetical protein
MTTCVYTHICAQVQSYPQVFANVILRVQNIIEATAALELVVRVCRASEREG